MGVVNIITAQPFLDKPILAHQNLVDVMRDVDVVSSDSPWKTESIVEEISNYYFSRSSWGLKFSESFHFSRLLMYSIFKGT